MLQVKIKPEFERDYLEIEPNTWYDVRMEILDRITFSYNSDAKLYLKRKFETRNV